MKMNVFVDEIRFEQHLLIPQDIVRVSHGKYFMLLREYGNAGVQLIDQ